jgi:NADPH:quinone reductase-like Zn-dependent oxidoreductase
MIPINEMEMQMKAAMYDRYGGPEVVAVRDMPKPVPKAGEVLIRVRATTVSSGDWRARSLTMPAGFGLIGRLVFGVSRPRQPVLGTELAGVVEEVGASVTAYKPGDEVIAFAGGSMGCHAEYRTMPADGAMALKPKTLSFADAAAVSFGAMTALEFLRRGDVKAGESVLVNGASGAVGVAFVQLLKNLGARVTAVCSGANADSILALGADAVIDYTRFDFTVGGAQCDVIVDTAGTAPYVRVKGILKEKGRLLRINGGLGDLITAPFATMGTTKRIVGGPAMGRPEDLHTLVALAAAGKLRPMIDEVYPLERIVEAHRRVDGRHKRGSVVVTMPLAA